MFIVELVYSCSIHTKKERSGSSNNSVIYC